jgi:hypothetical protein
MTKSVKRRVKRCANVVVVVGVGTVKAVDRDGEKAKVVDEAEGRDRGVAKVGPHLRIRINCLIGSMRIKMDNSAAMSL